MLFKVTSTAKAKGEDPFISAKAINQLVKNFLEFTMKVDTTDGSLRKMHCQRDSYSIWYSLDEIRQLIRDNTNERQTPSGIRIYLGVHSNTQVEYDEMPNRPPEYINHHTGVLVATFCNEEGVNVDILNTEDYISLSGATGKGADEGSISPPPYPIPGSKVDPS